MRSIMPIAVAGLAGASLVLSACSEQPSAQRAPAAPSPPAWMLADEPEGAVGVVEAKGSALEGEAIVLRGIIGGSVTPLSGESPVFNIVDTGLYNRCTAEKDHCSTPWDYCCAPREDVVANSATVQLVDASGGAIAGSPVAGGLAGLDEVIVIGTVAPRPDERVLTVRATGVYRVGG